ncbi:DNA repair protein RecN [Mycoplasmatota bacterium]|nr:DNA repair protein RecN [Mycoplasmatota bacterium]
MLSQLKIKNFAIIDDLTISFDEQMTVLTGETGSGKSIIIYAISLLLGERASNDMIRFDKEKAIVEGLFYYENSKIDQILSDFGIDYEDQMLIIIREISKNGRNVCRLNGNLVTVNQLKKISGFLVDVHVQHDTQRLINTNNYLYLIDSFCDEGFSITLTSYQQELRTYLGILKKYNDLIKENALNQEKLDFYQYQQNEFKQANISLVEYQQLNEKRNQFVNYDKIFENLNTAHEKLNENKILENIYHCANHLSKIAQISTKYNEMSENLRAIYYQLDDLSSVLSTEIQVLDYNPNALDQIESRLNVYSTLKRKYKMEIDDLIDYQENLKEKMENIENFDIILNSLQEQLKSQYQITLSHALKLREKRQKVAEEIKTHLINHLNDLKLLNTTFNILFNYINLEENDYLNPKIFNENGIDTIDFHVSFNLGEPAKPLSKVASGGELSRFMLGLKTILTEKQKLSTIVFDEIDTGVSGITASAIAQKIKSISNNTQVLCISHLPQVASISDHHLYISKIEENNRTHTNVKLLNKDERIMEIAKMIAGDDINEVVINNAKNLLKIE